MRKITLIVLLIFAGCSTIPTSTPLSIATSISTPGETDMSSPRYLALGDSYTIGERVSEETRWPSQLVGLLETEGIHTDVTIIARTGWTVHELWEGIQAEPPNGTYELVTLLIGVNDQYRGYPVDGYRGDFHFILGKAIEYAGGDPGKVIVLSIPDWGFTPFADGRDTKVVSLQIDEFNAINRDETENVGAHYVDVTDISRMAMDDFELIAHDRLHPSAKMYTMWAKKVLPISLEILQ